jgi:NAD(P)-dependent dehydrogenase (short-subunit alcohol dehydrogenase family)
MSEDRRAIVVGGAGGIGRDICRRLAEEDYSVVVADLNFGRAQEVLAGLSGDGHKAISIDVADEASVRAAFDAIEAESPASILVVASGGPVVRLGQGGTIAAMTIANWTKTLSLNLTGVFTCVQKFAQLRLSAPIAQSRVVIIGSAAGLMAGNGTDVAYSVSKSALFGFVRLAAYELADAQVTVNIVAPGPVGTEEFYNNSNEQIRAKIASLSLLNRLATPEEVSEAVLYLMSPRASYITGSSIDINGGIHMR